MSRTATSLAAAFLAALLAPAVNAQNATIGDFVWYDANANGVQDVGEPGLQGVPVRLLTPGGNQVASTRSDASGAFSMSVAPGDYVLEVYGWCVGPFSPADAGGDDTKDSDVSPTTYRTGTFTAASGANPNWDIGITAAPVSFSGTVWEDADGDGIRDAGESGRAGVAVSFFRSCWGTFPGTVTDANGDYLFDNVAALRSGYQERLQVSRPSQRYFTPANQGGDDSADSDFDAAGNSEYSAIPSGGAWTDVDAGLGTYSGSNSTLSTFAWHDANANGIQDGGEAGIEGVPIYLVSEFGTSLISGVSNGSGVRTISVVPGVYLLRFVNKSCFGTSVSAMDVGGDDSVDNDFHPVSGDTALFLLPPATTDDSRDLGITTAPVSYSGRVWFDADGDGLEEGGEPGIAGVGVTMDTGCWTSAGSRATDASGNYSFPRLISGTNNQQYRARMSRPSGFFFTSQDVGGDDSIDSDADPAGYLAYETLAPGSVVTDRDGGLIPDSIGQATIGDRAWYDSNGNGTQDPGETRVAGVSIRYMTVNGADLGFQHSNLAGDYLFPGLAPGKYFLQGYWGTICRGVGLTARDSGSDDAIDSDFATTGLANTDVFDAAVGNNLDWDIGIISAPAAMSGRLWRDLDGDGIRDAGEPPVAGVRVWLYSGSCVGGNLVSTFSALDGTYSFPAVTPGGNWRVFFERPGNLSTLSPADQGGDDTVDSDPDPNGYTDYDSFSSGAVFANRDAGYASGTLGMIGDRVWLDADADGVQDAGEVGAPGVTVRLYSSIGSLVGSDTTDGSGNYAFSNLASGTYFVEFELPSGFAFTLRDQGSDTADSDADASTGRTVNFTLGSGANDASRDAGLVSASPASVGDFVWQDFDGDGIQDAGESGANNVTVRLYTASGTQVSQTTTSPAGAYAFNNLLPGDYYLVFVLPGGFGFSPQNQGGDDDLDSDADGSGRTADFTLAPGSNDSSQDCGLVPAALADVGDRVWLDSDHDGIQDPGEPGFPGVGVQLFTSADALVSATSTNGSGNYSFSGLAPGSYYLVFDLPTGYTRSPADQTSDANDSDANVATGRTANFSLALGQSDLTRDSGIYDGTAPTAPGPVTTSSHQDPTTDQTIDVTWGASTDSGSGVDGYGFTFDNSAGWTCDQVKDVEEGVTSASSSTLVDGSYYFHVCARDNGGNWSGVTTGGPYIVDTVAPSSPGSVSSSSHDGGPSNATTIEVSWGASTDATSGVAEYRYDFTGSATPPACSSLGESTASTSASSSPLAAGTWYFHVCAVDEAGNGSAVTTGGPYEIDLSAPEVTLIDSVASSGGAIGEDEIVNAAITEILVSFDEAMDATLAETTTSYQLIEAGSDETLDTTVCGALQGDDVAIAIDSAGATATRRAPWK
ncbi:MAG: SdrD B-like domain-containing protein [Thermoanaerobaculia bacterium]